MKTASPVSESLPRVSLDLVQGAKEALSGVDRQPAELALGEGFELVREYPHARPGWDSPMLAHLLWERVRDIPYNSAGDTVGQAIAGALRGQIHVCGAVVDLVLATGDLKAALLKQRAQLEAQLEKLPSP